jgi:hypothetical protein
LPTTSERWGATSSKQQAALGEGYPVSNEYKKTVNSENLFGKQEASRTHGDDANDNSGQFTDPCEELRSAAKGVDIRNNTDESDCRHSIRLNLDMPQGNPHTRESPKKDQSSGGGITDSNSNLGKEKEI